MTLDPIVAAAARLAEAARTRTPCAPVRDLLPGGDVAAAYAVQDLGTRRALSAGRRLIGRKIGLTSRAVQRQLGVDQPDYGMLWADIAYADGEPIPTAGLLQPRAETEIAFVLDRDLTLPDPTPVDLVRAVAYVVPAIEVVDSRIAGWNIQIVDTIADNASSGVFVLGSRPTRIQDFDPRLCGMVMERRGEPVSVGAGAACLGNPWVALRWLARTMVEVGRPLCAGDVVMSGALGPLVPVVAGDALEARISGLGTVRAILEGP